MTQLIFEGIAFPESQKGGYTAYEEDLGKEIEMISGRLVKEVRGVVWRVNYQYGYFNDNERNMVIAACRKGRRQPIICSFLPPEKEELITSSFLITEFSEPKFMWSANGKPLWADFSISLREEKPHI